MLLIALLTLAGCGGGGGGDETTTTPTTNPTPTSAPVITTQPSSRNVTTGQTVTFTVVASGTAPLTYQWVRDGVNVGNNAASYTTPATTISDSGARFSVVVTNAVDHVHSNVANLTVTSVINPPTGMRIGMNFWNIGWGAAWRDYFKPDLNWNTVTDPWLPAFLADLAPFDGPLRFMDFGGINRHPIVNWADRKQKRDDHYGPKTYPVAAFTAKYAPENPINDVAYEWMIDLCNRTGKDMWVCVPTFANEDYWTRLATLIRDTLDPGLNVYVEYSNETWNGGFMPFQYTIDQGIALDVPAPRDQPNNAKNKWYQGSSWHVWHSLKIFKAFQDVFGASAMGTRVIRVSAFSGNMDGPNFAYREVVYSGYKPDGRTINKTFNPVWNPNGQKADLFAIAPYIGPPDYAAGTGEIDGAAANVAARFRANVDWTYVNYIQPAIDIAERFDTPLGCYEGGQQLITNAAAWNSNPAIYDEYLYMLDKWKPANFEVFCNYTLYGYYSSGGAWGAKPDVTATTAASPKYRALLEWMNAR